MRVVFDVRACTALNTGVGNYVRHLLAELSRLPGLEMLPMGQVDNLDRLPRAGKSLKVPYSLESHPQGDWWEHFQLPRQLKNMEADIFHSPQALLPLRQTDCRLVLTVHDLVPFLIPLSVPRKYAAYMRILLPRVTKRADKIIAVSQCTKTDLVNYLNVPPEKISVVYEAAGPEFKPYGDDPLISEVCRRYGLGKPFILHLGHSQPRKNLSGLLKAYLRLPLARRREVNLVIAGGVTLLGKKTKAEIEKLNPGPEVIFLGPLPQNDLPALMNAALAFAFPSFYEGFGLPVLEAMSCGTPVMTAKAGSLPEVAGEAALMVNPYDQEEMAHALDRLMTDSSLRYSLAQAGRQQAARFSWSKAAQETKIVYDELGSSRP